MIESFYTYYFKLLNDEILNNRLSMSNEILNYVHDKHPFCYFEGVNKEFDVLDCDTFLERSIEYQKFIDNEVRKRVSQVAFKMAKEEVISFNKLNK